MKRRGSRWAKGRGEEGGGKEKKKEEISRRKRKRGEKNVEKKVEK